MPAATANQTPPFLQLVGRVLWNGIATADAFTLAVLAGLLTLAYPAIRISNDTRHTKFSNLEVKED